MYIRSLLPVVQRKVETSGVEDRNDWAKIVERGKKYTDTFLSMAHEDVVGEMLMSQPTASLRAYASGADDWEAGALATLKSLKHNDPAWAATYPGPRRHI
jgi:hypothetical protein